MKKFAAMMLALLMMTAAAALADGPVLLMEMPEDALMVEDITFDDGDFIRTYQLAGGTLVHLLRYAAFDMTADDLVASEWPEAKDVAIMMMGDVSDYPTRGVTFRNEQDGAAVDVKMVLVDCGEGTLVFEAVSPEGSADKKAVETMIKSMIVVEGAATEEPEVG